MRWNYLHGNVCGKQILKRKLFVDGRTINEQRRKEHAKYRCFILYKCFKTHSTIIPVVFIAIRRGVRLKCLIFQIIKFAIVYYIAELDGMEIKIQKKKIK